MHASKIDTAYYRLRSSQYSYRARESALLRWLDEHVGPDCYISWSAGKDSTVVAHAARRVNPALPVLMVDPGVPIHWTDDDRARMLGWCPDAKLFAFAKFARADVSHEQDADAYRAAVHRVMFADLEAHARARGLRRRITGIRAAESKGRARCQPVTLRTLQPILGWSTDDVWTYTVAHDLPWLSIYDHVGPDARNGLVGKNGVENGRLAYLRRYYPAAFRLACELFDARAHV